MPAPSGSAPAPDKVNTNALNQETVQQMQTDTGALICNTNPPYCVKYVRVSYLANVFAFRASKDDTNRVIQVSYKTRGAVTRPGQGNAGYESRQIDLQVNPQAYDGNGDSGMALLWKRKKLKEKFSDAQFH